MSRIPYNTLLLNILKRIDLVIILGYRTGCVNCMTFSNPMPGMCFFTAFGKVQLHQLRQLL